MYISKNILLFALFSFILIARAQDDFVKCAHNRFKDEPGLLEVDEEYLPDQTRSLQTITYPNIRIKTDYTRLVDGTTEFKNYIRTELLPPVIDYYQAALRVKQPLTSPLKLGLSSICGFDTPTALLNGADTDFFVIVSSERDSDNWVAAAAACYLSSGTKRPLIAKMLFNMVYTKAAKGDVLTHEKNMYLTMHEMLHALGFSGSNFRNFIDANGNPRTGHIKSVVMNGSKRTVLDVEPLTSKLRRHFGCSTLEGAYMEDDGGAGTEGSHFERRHFLYEVMTSGVIDGRRISEFSLSVLEGSGWYVPNYAYAEPFYFGQGQGCNFLKMSCSNYKFDFEEFCSGGNRGCSPVGRGGGICTTDSRSDDCSYYLPVIDFDCENPAAEDNARYPELQVFGRGAGSKCFDGDLTKLNRPTQTSFCFKYICSGSGLTTSLQILVGNTKVACKAEGPVKVPGYNGGIQCPDPISFCTTVGKPYCPRNCMGRGTCVNNVCKCKPGFTGIDCALAD